MLHPIIKKGKLHLEQQARLYRRRITLVDAKSVFRKSDTGSAVDDERCFLAIEIADFLIRPTPNKKAIQKTFGWRPPV